jgi:hypothetical protein
MNTQNNNLKGSRMDLGELKALFKLYDTCYVLMKC